MCGPFQKTAAGGTYITRCPFASASYNLAGTAMAYGDSLTPYVMAATNTYNKWGGNNWNRVTNDPTQVGSGTFASGLQGAVQLTTITDQGRTAYLQIQSYTDTYSITNAGNQPCEVKVWHVKRKTMYPLVGTLAGRTVAGAGAPTYAEGTGDFEDQVEYAAVLGEYTDTQIYDAIATWPLPYITNVINGTSMGQVSGSRANVYGALYHLPMTKWPGLKPYNKIKLAKKFTLAVGQTRKFTYKYKMRSIKLYKLAQSVIESNMNSSADAGEWPKHLKIMFQCCGSQAISNDADYQVDNGNAVLAIKNIRKLIHRTVANAEPASTFVDNSIYSADASGFTRQWTMGVPEVVYSSGMPVGPVAAPAVGHLPVDNYARNAAGVWVPNLASVAGGGQQVVLAA